MLSSIKLLSLFSAQRRWIKEMIFAAISKHRTGHYCAAADLACCRMLGVQPKQKAIKKKSPDLSLVKNSDDHWPEERDKIIAMLESRSNESLETLSMRLERLILECKSPSPRRSIAKTACKR